jgi:hypothetical protein
MTKPLRLCALLLAAAVAGGVAPAQPPPIVQRGRIQLRFDGLSRRAAQVSVVTLDGPMLRIGIRMLSAQEPDARARAVLAQLEGVYVKSLRFNRRGEYSARDLAAIRRQLRAPGWGHIISVHSRGTRRTVDVYIMSSGNKIAGLAIIAAYPRELRVVNLVGSIRPGALAQLGGHFGIPRVDTARRPR